MATIIALHGYGSKADTSSTIKTLKAGLAQDNEFIAVSYDEHNPSSTASKLKSIADGVDDELVIIGISLGGFWARWLANQVSGAKLVLLNPSINAHENLKKYIGNGKMTDEIADEYKNYKPASDKGNIPILAIVATDDDVVPPEDTISLYKSRGRVITTSGGHRLATLSSHIKDIEEFINQVPVSR